MVLRTVLLPQVLFVGGPACLALSPFDAAVLLRTPIRHIFS